MMLKKFLVYGLTVSFAVPMMIVFVSPQVMAQVDRAATGSRREARDPSGRDVRRESRSFGEEGESIKKPDEERRSTGLPVGSPSFGREVDLYQVHVLGQVLRPGTYRLPASTRLNEALGTAGSVVPTGSKRNIELRRQNKAQVVDLFAFESNGDLNQNPYLFDNDVIFVPYVGKMVGIRGPVIRPGDYELREESSIQDVITLAGGFTQGIEKQGQVAVIRFDEKGEKTIIKIPNIETELKAASVESGDVIIVPHVFNIGKSFDYDVDHLPADRPFYPSLDDNIYVFGAVAQPGAYAFQPQLTILKYVGMAGPSKEANWRWAKVMTPDGKIIRNPSPHQINPGDSIIVPRKSFTVDNTLKWYNTLSSTVFTGFALKQLLQ